MASDLSLDLSRYLSQSAATELLSPETTSADWMLWVTAGMLFVAVIQAGFFFIQLQLMKRSMRVAETATTATENSVNIMRDTAARQLRAYIAVERAWIEFPEPGIPKVTVIVKNAGQTPAHNLRHWIHQWIERYPLSIELPEPPEDFVMSSSILGSGATHEMQITHPQQIINPCCIHEIGTPEGTIYVYGAVTYQDIYGNEHFMKYRLMHGGSTQARPGYLSPCEAGNEAS
ncbi:hypothetical protein F3I62_15800 [Pseudomonas sp. R-28-1W-6]|uniref:hypothetical protein n=1 Tax=Pseudomonas sp. R-28-1W-6 TaxID=2650101 RepID=UPI001365A3F0|nr:hypothetical protein [Pseudomonas sp. R-28-1W-6]MWV13566.1 hypothetical protein [Pseudomonas sp. R-28-1W-6]